MISPKAEGSNARDEDLVLPEEVKPELRKVYGRLHKSANDAVKDLANVPRKKLITIGDITSYNVISAGASPDIIVYDGLENKERVKQWMKSFLDSYMAVEQVVENPAGRIAAKVWDIADFCLASNKKCKVVVKGEEDMTVLPFLMQAPKGTLILYGLRDKGVVSILVDEEAKKFGERLLGQMNVHEEKKSPKDKAMEERLKEMFRGSTRS